MAILCANAISAILMVNRNAVIVVVFLIRDKINKMCTLKSGGLIMKAHLIFFLAIFIISALFIGHFRLTFSPFSVSFLYWHRTVGVILIVAGCLVYNIGEHISGYKKGLDKGVEIVLKELKERYNHE